MSFAFFQPTLPNRTGSTRIAQNVFGAQLTKLVVRTGRPARVGLWGAGYNGDPLELRAYRGGARVSGSPTSPVKLTRAAVDANLKVQEFVVTGLRDGDTLVGVSASHRPMTDPLPVRELRNTPSGVMQEAALNDEYRHTRFRGVCPHAIPYLALRDKKMGGMAVLRDSAVGGPLMDVHGLCVHTTAGKDTRSAYLMARWGCVEGWNNRGVSAHFGVSGDGTLVQFVPTTFAAYAQFSPGNEHWVSVEVDNDGKKAMTARQLTAVRQLFQWVVNAYGVPKRLATGCLFPAAPHFDKATAAVCDRADVETTTDPYQACMSRGVSCHWWLEARKTGNSHACPGKGIMNQLDEVALGAG